MSLLESTYTVVLSPRPIRKAVNAALRCVTPRAVNRHGAVVVLNPNDPVISGALTLGVYEKPETAFFRRVCRPGMAFLDIGANVGYYTALALSIMKGSGRVISLEPDPESFEYLQKTAAANGPMMATCVQKAASDRVDCMTLFTSKENRGDNRLYANELSDGTCRVETAPVDSILEDLNFATPIDLVKMDVQGFEPFVLKGMRRTIQRSARMVLMTEFWPFGIRAAGSNPAHFLSSLEAAGFQLSQLDNSGTLVPIPSHDDLVRRYTGRHYTNVVGIKCGLPRDK